MWARRGSEYQCTSYSCQAGEPRQRQAKAEVSWRPEQTFQESSSIPSLCASYQNDIHRGTIRFGPTCWLTGNGLDWRSFTKGFWHSQFIRAKGHAWFFYIGPSARRLLQSASNHLIHRNNNLTNLIFNQTGVCFTHRTGDFLLITSSSSSGSCRRLRFTRPPSLFTD